jgi:hypothetical protein
VPQTENWERALRYATGEYILVIGDDDGLLPDTCALARELIFANRPGLLTWPFAFYYWPRYLDRRLANRIFAKSGVRGRLEWKDSEKLLAAMYGFSTGYADYPMIYNSFIHRKLIEDIRGHVGRYFVGSTPDIASAVVNLRFCSRILRYNQPLSFNAASHNSVGHRLLRSGDKKLQADAIRDAGQITVHSSMVPTVDMNLLIGNELLIIKDELFPSDGPALDYSAMLAEAVRRINEVSGQYESVLTACRCIGAKNGILIRDDQIPQKAASQIPPASDRCDLQGDDVAVEIDCTSHGVENIFDAANALSKILAKMTVRK